MAQGVRLATNAWHGCLQVVDQILEQKFGLRRILLDQETQVGQRVEEKVRLDLRPYHHQFGLGIPPGQALAIGLRAQQLRLRPGDTGAGRLDGDRDTAKEEAQDRRRRDRPQILVIAAEHLQVASLDQDNQQGTDDRPADQRPSHDESSWHRRQLGSECRVEHRQHREADDLGANQEIEKSIVKEQHQDRRDSGVEHRRGKDGPNEAVGHRASTAANRIGLGSDAHEVTLAQSARTVAGRPAVA